jgi:hypothetical protein
MKDSWFHGSARSALCDLSSLLRSGCRCGGKKDSPGCAIGLERVSSAFLFGSGGVCFEKAPGVLVEQRWRALGSRGGVCRTALKQDSAFGRIPSGNSSSKHHRGNFDI